MRRLPIWRRTGGLDRIVLPQVWKEFSRERCRGFQSATWGNMVAHAPLAGRPGRCRERYVARAAAVFSNRQRILLLIGFAVVLALRVPGAWWHGRFLYEEGSIFMAFAWHRPASEALWRSFAGYLNLGANGATLAMVALIRAGLLPLGQAPRFTMMVAMLFQIVPAILILTARGRWLANRRAVLGCLLIVAISPFTEEVFANVLHIQFHLALASALILALGIPAARLSRIAYCMPLVLAPLCGPGAIVLLPLFVLRTAVDRDRARLVQTGALAFGTAVQMLLFFTPNPLRGHLLDPATLSNVLFVRLAALPFASVFVALPVGERLYSLYLTGGPGWWLMTVLSLSCFGWLVFTALRGGFDSAFWLVMSGLLLALVSFDAGMLAMHPSRWFSPGSAGRYNFLPLVLIGLGLVALAMRNDRRYVKICRCLVVLMLWSSALTFPYPIPDMNIGPDWQAEVAVWQKNHDYLLATWPPHLRVDLSDRDLPCSAFSLDNMAASDPTYCEGNWLALVIGDSKLPARHMR